jgi:hypothetical protein
MEAMKVSRERASLATRQGAGGRGRAAAALAFATLLAVLFAVLPSSAMATPQFQILRTGAVANANFNINEIDDYRVNADIAVLDGGMSATLERVNVFKRTDCTNPDPLGESKGHAPPSAETFEDPKKWWPDERLDGPGKRTPYGCLENAGEPYEYQNEGTHGQGVAQIGAEIDGAGGGLGIARGARIWSVKVRANGLNFGSYPKPKSTPVTLKGSGFGVLTTKSGSFECEESTLRGAMSEAPGALSITAKQLSLTAEYGKCHAFGLTSTVTMNSCHYNLGVKNAGPPFSGTLGVACEKEGDKIEYKAFTSKGALVCTAKVAAQTGLEGLSLSTTGIGAERGIEGGGEVKGVKYELTGSTCGGTSTNTDGVIKGTTTLSGSRETETHAGVYLVGQESAEEARQPHFEAQLEYNPELATKHVIAGLDWVAAHADQIDAVEMGIGCAQKGDPVVEEEHLDYVACDSTVLNEAIKNVIDKGVVVVVAAGNGAFDVKSSTPRDNPEVLTVSAVSDFDGIPGGLADTPEQKDDWRRKTSGFGQLVDIAAPAGATSGASAEISGAAAALASQCPAHNRAGVEFIEDTLMAEGDTGSIAEGGWEDDSGDGWKEPLLDLKNEKVFNPVQEDTKTHKLNHEPSESCPWLSRQAESDVSSDGRADLVTIGGKDKAAYVYPGTHEGYETGKPITSLKGQLDPALRDGKGQYAIDTADVNGDRHADLVTFEGGKGAYVYPGNGEGGFGSPVQSLKGTTLSFDGSEGTFEPIAVADVNGDSRADLVGRLTGGQILTFLGQADGSFGEAIISSGLSLDSALLDGEGNYFLDTIDINGDGLADLVTSNTNGTVYVYLGRTDGKFEKTPVTAASVNPIMNDGKGEEIIGLGDVNRDHRADLLTLEGETLELRKAKADGSFEAPTVAYAGKVDSSLLDGKGQELIGLQDYSRDGLADLVSVTEKGEVLTYTAQRDFTFAAPVASAGTIPSIRGSEEGQEFLAEKPFLRRVACTAGGCIWKPPVHAPRFDGAIYPLSVKGSGFKTFTTKSGSFECEEASLKGTLSAPSSTQSLTAEYGKCKAFGLTATVTMNGCHYNLGVQNVGPPYKGTWDVACEKVGEAIEYKAFTSKGALVCTAKIAPQSGLTGINLSNTGEKAERGIVAEAEVKGVKYELTGSTCGGTSTNTDGVIKGTTTLTGESEAKVQNGFYLTGKA